MRKRLSLLVALIMAFTIFWIPGQSAAAYAEEEKDTVQATGETTTTVVQDDGLKNESQKDSVQAMAGPFKVTFISNGGTEIKPQTLEPNEEGKCFATKPTDPTKASDSQYSYKFAGWYSDEALTKSFDFATEVTADITLYAKWTKTSVTPNKVGALGIDEYTATKESIKVKWSLKSNTGKLSKAKVTLRRSNTSKVYSYEVSCTQWNTKTFTGLSDGTWYEITVTPYYNGSWGNTVKKWVKTNAPVYNGAYKPGKYEYYYVDGVKQRNKTISFKDTRYGTNKYKLWHYYDSDGIFRGRSKAMYNKIKNMSSKKYLIAIDRTNNVMCIYVGGKGNWRPFKYWSCVTGRMKSGDYHPTPLGTYTIKSRKLTFSGYGIPEKLKNRYSVWYCSRFVGSVFIHSQLYKYGSKSSFIPGGRAMGVNASHGCVRLYKSYAYWVYKNCAKGTKVVVMK